MAPAPFFAGFGQPASLRRRVTSLALALLAEALLLLLLLTLAPSPSPPPRRDRQPTTVTLLPDGDDTPAKTSAEAARKRTAAAPPLPPAIPRPTLPRAAAVVPDPPPLAMIVLSREAYAASDISRVPAAPATGAAAEAAAGPDTSGDSQVAAGRGPGGEPLYAAEWYREPTDAELGGYLSPGGAREGWGLIACRTVANFRVEDCSELGQSPPGSGLARAIRQAAWQFRVRPPRIGGKALVGAWVSIRIDYSQKAAR